LIEDNDINQYSREELLEVRKEIDAILNKSDDSIIQKPFGGYEDFDECVSQNSDKDNPEAYCGSIKHKIEKDMDSWEVLTKLFESNLLDSKKLLKDYLIKVANCPDVTKLYQKLLDGWKTEGEGDVSSIEKIINSCKSEGGNLGRKY